VAAVQYTFGWHPVAAVQYTFAWHPVAAVQYTFGWHPVAALQYTFGWHPVAAAQYTFTHKQYTEYTERNIHNNKNLEVRAVPRLCEFYPGICLTTVEKTQKPPVRVVKKCPDISVVSVQYTFTHKQYTEQHNETEYTERNIYNNKNISDKKEHIT
jgi:hypothetical protein